MMNRPGPRLATSSETSSRILVGACGAASVLALPGYLLAMRALPCCHITVIMTASAAAFLPPRSIELCADTVHTSDRPGSTFGPNHVRLPLDHDAIVIIPATAHILGVVAHGQAPSLLTAAILAAPYPGIFFPAMNHAMWRKPAVQRNVTQLRADGHDVVEPDWRPTFEVAIKKVQENPALPAPERMVDLLAKQLSSRRDRDG